MLKSRFLWGRLFQKGVWLRVGGAKASTPGAVRGASSELGSRHRTRRESPERALAGSEGVWEVPSGFIPNRPAPSLKPPTPAFASRGSLSETCSAGSIDPIRATVPGTPGVAQCSGDANCFSATWLSPRGARQAGICLLCIWFRQARSKSGGCFNTPTPAPSALFSVSLPSGFSVFNSSPFLVLLS